MKKAEKILAFVVVFLFLSAFSADSVFPEITGKTLNGKTITVPKDTKGSYALIGIAYSLKSHEYLESWLLPVYKSFKDNPFFPVKVYFIPMTANIKTYSNDKIVAKMKEVLDPVLYDNIVVYTGEIDNYVKTLTLKDKDIPYFFVLNPEGKIVHTESGQYTDAKFEAISDAISGD